MRPAILCFLALLCAACGRDAAPGVDEQSPADAGLPPAPAPEAPEPEAPEPEAPEPEAPEPEAPMFAAAEPGADGVFRGVDSVLFQLTGRGPVPEQVWVSVDLPAGDTRQVTLSAERQPIRRGITYGTHHASFGLADDAWIVQAWWPGDHWAEHPDAGRATVRVTGADDALIAEAAFDVRSVARAEDDCDPLGFANRCARDQICALLPRPVVGRCFPASINGWQTADGVVIDLGSSSDNYGAPPPLTVTSANGLPRALHPEPVWGDGWRHRVRVDSMDGATLYLGAHAFDLVVRPPEERALDEACDPTGVTSVCAGALECGVDAACIVSAPPEITAAAFNWGRLHATLHLRGRDVDGDVAAIELHDAGTITTYAVDGWRLPGAGWHVGLDVALDGGFELVWALDDHGGGYAETPEVVVIDREGNRSAPFAPDAGYLPGRTRDAPLPDGALCDRMETGMLGTCADARCVLADGERDWRCQAERACEAPERFPLIEGGRADGTTRGGVNATWLPCAPPVPGFEGGHRIEAAVDGFHRVRIEGQNLTAAALRTACDAIDLQTQAACVGAETVAGTDTLTVRRWLRAGQSAWLTVESFAATAYTVTLETP